MFHTPCPTVVANDKPAAEPTWYTWDSSWQPGYCVLSVSQHPDPSRQVYQVYQMFGNTKWRLDLRVETPGLARAVFGQTSSTCLQPLGASLRLLLQTPPNSPITGFNRLLQPPGL